jgi:plastocyanin|tara:strand:+ start:748 stop:1146 length:399 start_codon:yes stop_codon:yes gene_type:complete
MRSKTAIRKPVGSIGAVVATALLAGACGGGSGSSGVAVEPEDGVLRIVADDTHDFDADAYVVSAGELRVDYVQSGFQNHTLVIEGIEDQMRLEVENGGRDSGTVTLQPGRYIIYCDVAGHRDGGMEARLLVE